MAWRSTWSAESIASFSAASGQLLEEAAAAASSEACGGCWTSRSSGSSAAEQQVLRLLAIGARAPAVRVPRWRRPSARASVGGRVGGSRGAAPTLADRAGRDHTERPRSPCNRWCWST